MLRSPQTPLFVCFISYKSDRSEAAVNPPKKHGPSFSSFSILVLHLAIFRASSAVRRAPAHHTARSSMTPCKPPPQKRTHHSYFLPCLHSPAPPALAAHSPLTRLCFCAASVHHWAE